MIKHTLITALLLAGSALAQVKITYGSSDASGDCRIKPEELKPIIAANNPFFVNHHWDEASKAEVVQMSPDRFLTISQEGCLRHHIKLELAINREAADPYNANFYPKEVFAMMNRVFFNNHDYYSWKLEFEQELLKAFARVGVDSPFQFHVNNLNFQCLFKGGDWGASLDVEIIRLVMKENVRLPGIESYKDDGHKK